MLSLYNLTCFVRPQTIEKFVEASRQPRAPFQTESATVTDHVGESGRLTFVYTSRVELGLTPYNSFHYWGDYEVGLTIDRGRTIAELEALLTSGGFEFEAGHFQGNPENSYYLIPRKQGVFTPFFVIAENDSSRNRIQPSIRQIQLQVDQTKLAATEEFLALVGVRDKLGIECLPGEKNQVRSVTAEVPELHPEEIQIMIDEFDLTFHQSRLQIRLNL